MTTESNRYTSISEIKLYKKFNIIKFNHQPVKLKINVHKYDSWMQYYIFNTRMNHEYVKQCAFPTFHNQVMKLTVLKKKIVIYLIC